MEIRKVTTEEKHFVDRVVSIHLSTFPQFFLTFLGRGFLKEMYKSYVHHSESDLLIAIENGDVVGFIAFSYDMSGLYKYMITHRVIPFAWYSFLAFFRRPKVLLRLLRAFLKPSESKRDDLYVELASIGVDSTKKSLGIGSKLIRHFVESIDFSKYKYITLETDAVDNEYANAFYRKNGFTVERMYETREGRKMFEYRCYENTLKAK